MSCLDNDSLLRGYIKILFELYLHTVKSVNQSVYLYFWVCCYYVKTTALSYRYSIGLKGD